MQGGRRGPDNFFEFGDPFAGFEQFGPMGHESLLSSVFGGRDPFGDSVFASPFGRPFGSPFGNPFGSMLQQNLFGPGASPFFDPPAGILEHQQPQLNKRRGPVIEELNSDDEKGEEEGTKQKRVNSRKHRRSESEPYIEHPDDKPQERKNRQLQYRNVYNGGNNVQSLPKSHSFSFQSSTVTYGGVDGAFYTKSCMKRAGSDGVSFEEYKEADSTTGQATHRVSKGLKEKGHSLTRNLNSDGRVDTMQTLHNLNEDELAGFEDAWKGNARKHMPGLSQRLEGSANYGPVGSGQTSRGNWALPSNVRAQHSGGVNSSMRHGTVPPSQSSGGRNAHDGSHSRVRG